MIISVKIDLVDNSNKRRKHGDNRRESKGSGREAL